MKRLNNIKNQKAKIKNMQFFREDFGGLAFCFLVFGLFCVALTPYSIKAKELKKPEVYVPYEDLPALIDPANKAILMERSQFEELLTTAEKLPEEGLKLGQITKAQYSAQIRDENVALSGSLEVVSMSREPVMVPLAFAQLGLNRVVLDDKPAPLGYDRQGRLVLIVTSRGTHKVEVEAKTKLQELSSGGMQFSISIPEATAGTMSLTAPGDLEIHSSSPHSETVYDKSADKTSVDLIIGGQNKLTVILMGNGRQEDDKAILLGESAATVKLTATDQSLECLYTVQVLKRGVRQLQFRLPAEWTITQVTCPNLVRWSIDRDDSILIKSQIQILTVRLSTGKVGTVALRIQAACARKNQTWSSPRIELVDADAQRGYLMVNTDETLGVRGETLASVRREDISAAALVTGLDINLGGRLYFHWGQDWSVNLELEEVTLRRSIKEQQKITVSTQQVTLTGDFEITAVERELFAMTFVLRNISEQWQIRNVLINQQKTGFEYRTETQGDRQLLKIELKKPVQPENMTNVTIVLQNIPRNWEWPSNANPRRISVPLIESQAETVSGYVSISAQGDLDAEPNNVPAVLEEIPVARMVTLGMERQIQYAYSYKSSTQGEIALEVSRKQPRQTCDSVGFVNVRPEDYSGNWRIIYTISRASDKKLYLLADKSIGREISITSSGVQISSKSIVAPSTLPFDISDELSQQYDIWQLNLDTSFLGRIEINAHYERPVTGNRLKVPLVRPVCDGQINEHLAIQANEELALEITPVGAKEIDAIDLPPLPVQANRILAAYQLEAATAPEGTNASVSLVTSVHTNYEIPTALAVSAHLMTYLDAQLWQQTEANFQVANASRQFLTFKLPEGAQLWSLSVDGRQAKPQRSSEGDYQVVLGRLGGTVNVRIVYAYRPDDMSFDNTKLGGVELPGLKINQLTWNVVPPPDYSITSQKTNMQMLNIIRPKPAFVKLYDSIKQIHFSGILSPLSKARYQASRLQTGIDFQGGGEMMGGYVANGQAVRDDVQIQKSFEAKKEAVDAIRGVTSEISAGERSELPSVTRRTPQTQQERDRADQQQQLELQRQQTAEILIHGDEAKIPYTGNLSWSAGRGQMQFGAIMAEGRYTLPVNLIPTPGAGRLSSFVGLGASELVVGLTKQSKQEKWWTFGFLLMTIPGIALLVKKLKLNAALLAGILLAASFIAVWWPSVTSFANGIFWGDIFLIALMLIIFIVRWLLNRTGWIVNNRAVAAAVLIILSSMLTVTVSASQNQSPERLIVPYDTTPDKAADSGKVLVPYSRFVELWNRVHPQEPIDLPRPGTDISLADVKYNVTITQEQLNLVLTAEVRTFGKDWVTLALPVSGLAVTEAQYKGKDAQLQTGPGGMVLMLPGDSSGTLQLKAIAKPQYLGKMGSIKLSLPPLPAAVMNVNLPQNDLELEVDGIESPAYKQDTLKENLWTAALGMTRDITMRWLPKLGDRAGDSTLSSNSEHDVHAFHWSIIGVSKITYSFAGGERDRFTILVPKDVTLTDVKGTNLRDYRQLGESTLEGKSFKVIEVRLHRAAKKQFDLSVKWLSSLPIETDASGELQLVRAGDVSRESGTVTLYSAGGMEVKVTDVVGGRRMTIESDVSGGRSSLMQNTAMNMSPPFVTAERDSSDRAKPVAKYYWPYRPFSVSVQFSRQAAVPKINLDQLVRINTDRIELLVQANLSAEQGELFGASFALPKDYELLSVVGPAVKDFYERSNSNGNFVHIEFDRGQLRTTAAFVLVQNAAPPEDFNVPTIMYIDSVGHEKSKQEGRLAVQIAASFEAQTISSENLIGVTPQTLQNWLNSQQYGLVQFAYRYEEPNPSLRLKIGSRPTQISSEVFAGLVVKTTSASYTYRLRYKIDGSPVDQLSFSLPSEYASLAAVESPILRSLNRVDANELTTWTISLLNEVTGIVDIAVNFTLPIETSTANISIPRLITKSPEGQRTIAAVQNMSRHEIKIDNTGSLTVLPLSEQQAMIPAQMRESLQYVYQSYQNNWQLSLALTQAKAAARIQAVVDLLALTTVINRDGRCRYEVRVELQNRSEQFLKVQAPKGLNLWSARVASQPVKPVRDANSPAGMVLIPLVKTSPGGLPYDIVLYFADEGEKPLVNPLDGISRIKPPGISIAGIPVTRTTWSLRLPNDYKYVRPGGNMSPVVGIVEMLILNNEARLEQLGRLDQSVRELAVQGKGRQVDTAKYNYDTLNTKIASEIQQTEQYLYSNRSAISSEDYDRLKLSIEGQRQKQNVVLGSNSAFFEKQQEQTRNDMNTFLNGSISNAGVAEVARNNALNLMPGFIGDNERQQIERLNRELQESQQLMLDSRRQISDLQMNQVTDGKAAIRQPGKASKDLIFDEEDKEGEVEKALEELAKKTDFSIVQKQEQLREQLSQMSSNRFQRYTQSTQSQNAAEGLAVNKPDATTQPIQVRGDGMMGGGFGGGGMGGMAMGGGGAARGRGGRGAAPQGSATTGRPATTPQMGLQSEQIDDFFGAEAKRVGDKASGDSPVQADRDSSALLQLDLYTSQNVYSLPVSLPSGGEVQLDFARSSGQAELSVWAVPVKTITNLLATLVIAVLFVLMLGFMKLWSKYNKKRTIPARAIIVYVLLFIILTVLLGPLGLIASLLIILLNEARHAVFA
ncbi:MAG: hypothetical protein JW787_07640 [Sedimentisphaerales bacterium]|nr:hypothetical protein [Sedimentisphaerales bacterium]